MNRSIVLLISVIFLTSSSLKANDIFVRFSTLNIEEARKKAGAEGKLLFVDFHAKWCTPCKWMEQTTFKDESVAKLLNENFISLKVDIDDIHGFELKKTYEVKYLPTMLIFNSQGQLVERIEETLSPRLLLEKLSNHNSDFNKTITIHELNTSPIAPANEGSVKRDEMLLSDSEYKRYFEQSRNNKQSSYRVQVAVFSTYDTATQQVKKLQETFLEPITVVSEIRNGETLFKVRMGQFESYEEADSFRQILYNDYQIRGIVQ
jgi:thiol-disulfide isomerase/thioredoxin